MCEASCWVPLIKAAQRHCGRFVLFHYKLQSLKCFCKLFILSSIDIYMYVIMLYICTYIQLFEHRVFFYSREHHSHCVRPILQEGNLHSVHVVGQFLDVCLQLGERCAEEDERRELRHLII